MGSSGEFGAFETFKIHKALYHRTDSESLVKWSDSTGKDIHTCRFNNMGDDLILTRDPENLKAICASQVNDYDLGPDRMAILEPLIGTGVLNNAGEAWKHSRALLRPQFAREVVSDLKMEEQERHLDDMWPVVDTELAEDGWTGVIDLQSTFFNLTLRTSIDFLIGHKTNVQNGQAANRKGSSTKALSMREDYKTAAIWTYIKFLFGKKHWIIPSWSLQYRSERIRGFLRPFIRAALDRLDGKEDVNMTNEGGLISLEELVKGTKDPIKLENEIIGCLRLPEVLRPLSSLGHHTSSLEIRKFLTNSARLSYLNSD